MSVQVPFQIINKFGSDYVGDNGVDEVIYLCPYCLANKGSSDTKGHLYVNTKSLKYKCHRCDASGKVNRVLVSDKMYESNDNLSDEKLLHELDGILNESASNNKYPYKIPMKSALLHRGAMEYLTGRGYNEETIRRCNMRVGSLSDKYYGRIVLPNIVCDDVYTDMYCARTFIGSKPKYLNPSSSTKSDIVYNLHNIKPHSVIFICEGVFSAVSAGPNGVATYGKSVSINQVSKILSIDPKALYICLDPDANTESIKLAKYINEISQVPLYRVVLPEGKDPADLGFTKFMDIVESTPRYSTLSDELESSLLI